MQIKKISAIIECVRKVRFFSFIVPLFFICLGSASAQTANDWWFTLERGRQMYRQGNYGRALIAFEDARRQRRAMYERLERDFIEMLSSWEARRLGDSLDWVERLVQERALFAPAAVALEELNFRFPGERFNNSVSQALAALGSLKDYPEAEYWIGRVYLAEGELGLALSQFQRALSMRASLKNPGYATEILYRIANIHRIRQEFNEMERALLMVLETDALWSGSGFERQAMSRLLENDGVDRFLTMFRYANIQSEAAHRRLGFFYFDTGRHGRAQEHLMFSFLIQNTIIIEEVMRSRHGFVFMNLNALFAEIGSNRVLLDFIEESEYYRTAYFLAVSLFATGRAASARGIWAFLANQNRAGEWSSRSASQLANPQVPRAIGMP